MAKKSKVSKKKVVSKKGAKKKVSNKVSAADTMRKVFAKNPSVSADAFVKKVTVINKKVSESAVITARNRFLKLYEELVKAGKVKGRSK